MPTSPTHTATGPNAQPRTIPLATLAAAAREVVAGNNTIVVSGIQYDSRLIRPGDLFAALPGAGAVWHGHPVWSLGPAPGKSPVCYLKAYAGHVAFGLWRGQEIDDPSGRLTAGARTMASVKLRTAADVDAELFADWLAWSRDLERPAAA